MVSSRTTSMILFDHLFGRDGSFLSFHETEKQRPSVHGCRRMVAPFGNNGVTTPTNRVARSSHILALMRVLPLTPNVRSSPEKTIYFGVSVYACRKYSAKSMVFSGDDRTLGVKGRTLMS